MAGIKIEGVDCDTAQEVGRVGIIPVLELEPCGTKFKIGCKIFVAGEQCTRSDFYAAVAEAGLNLADFMECPEEYLFLRIKEVF